jgi:hypothetical protein
MEANKIPRFQGRQYRNTQGKRGSNIVKKELKIKYKKREEKARVHTIEN